MTKSERVRYETLLRVRDFGAAHRALFPESSTGGQEFAKVAQAVAEIDAHATAKLLAAQDGRRAKAAARSAVRRWMLIIARTARGVARRRPELERTLRMPSRESDVVLLTSARAFLDDGEPIKDDLVRLGLSATFLTEFRQAVDTFEEALAGRRAGRSSVAAGQAGIKAALAAGMDSARTLDVIVANTIGNDAVLFAKWQRDRRLVDGKGPRASLTVVTPPASPTVDTAVEPQPTALVPVEPFVEPFENDELRRAS